jgi:hypothetical protein
LFLVTGGDPLTMSTPRLESFLDPLLAPNLDRVQNIRIGTKAPANWPHRFLEDEDADDLLRLFERIATQRHLALMVHFAHPRELATPEAEAAIARIRSTGAIIRTQAPILRPRQRPSVGLGRVQEVAGGPVFVLEFLQARDPSWVRRPFFARYDPRATWFDQLRPLHGAGAFSNGSMLSMALGEESMSS